MSAWVENRQVGNRLDACFTDKLTSPDARVRDVSAFPPEGVRIAEIQRTGSLLPSIGGPADSGASGLSNFLRQTAVRSCGKPGPYGTVPRTAHARATKWMLPSPLKGRLARMHSRNAVRRSSESDMQYPGAGA